jgi:pullulanase/glycogen debranching enzyme
MHIRDLTAHFTSGVKEEYRGTYLGLIEPFQTGGLPYIKKLGINAVELLPVQDFGNIEVPYQDKNSPVYNTWNPYAKNHWGYMTSYFFAPESYYTVGATLNSNQYNGKTGQQVREFKEVVKTFHKNGIAVLLDVVYNHVSQYDYNPLKYIDKYYYFRLNNDCSFSSVSGCGNDLKTERPMVRRLILDSVKHWMKEYHIDGFRFDLAHLIDWETIDLIRNEAQKINSKVILIAEPWGGGYDPAKFSDHHWASWNDQIRNGIKGQNPFDALGFIFGKWQGENNPKTIQRYIRGSLRRYGGQYLDVSHSINYLESHDDHTLGDFIKIGLGEVKETKKIKRDQYIKLTPDQLQLNKLAALLLFTSQGPIMMHEGQEFARSKIIAHTDKPDSNVGKIDHNSYNKDNETNWLNFTDAKLNSILVNYYQSLIEFRKNHPAFRFAKQKEIHFYNTKNPFFIAYKLNHHSKQYFVLINADPEQEHYIKLPTIPWELLVDDKGIYREREKIINLEKIIIPSRSGMILRKI